MKSKYADIYIITNLINNKQYVGQTIKGYKHRWETHCRLARLYGRNCKLLIDRVIAKYGANNFKCELLEIVPLCMKDIKEQYYIKLYATYGSGYNLTIGGDFNPMSDKNIRIKHLNKMHSIEVREKMATSVKKAYTSDLRNWFSNHSKSIWKQWSVEEQKNCVRGFIHYNEQRKQQVSMLDANDQVIKIFSSCAEACKYCGRPTKEAGNLLKKCDSYNKNGKRSKMYGYYWTKP